MLCIYILCTLFHFLNWLLKEDGLCWHRQGKLKGRIWQRIRDDWQLYLFVLPALVYVIVFQILPLYGIQIAFRNYRVAFGIQGSPWVGLEHFKNFFRSYYCGRLIGNTFILNILA